MSRSNVLLSTLLLLFGISTIAKAAAPDEDTCKYRFIKSDREGWSTEARTRPQYEEVVAACTRLINTGPLRGDDLVSAYKHRALDYRMIDDYKNAAADYSELIRLRPNDTTFYVDRGDSYSSNGDYDRAIADLTEAIRLDPTKVDAWSMRAVAFSKKGDGRILPFKKDADYGLAIADLSETIRLRPDKASYFVDRGNAYKTTGKFEKALADFR